MRPDDIGTGDDSVLVFNTPTAAAKETFLYPTCLGHYYCDGRYRVDRHRYDSFLFMYIKCGKGYAEFDGKKQRLTAGSMIILDCYRPHKYYTLTGWETIWVHFDGPTARKYYDYATRKYNALKPSNPAKIWTTLNEMLDMVISKSRINEARLAKYLTDILTEYITSSMKDENSNQENLIFDESVRYISEHFHENITLEELADKAMLSPFYFTRLFKKNTGFTPYQYLITVRLDYACYLLRTGNLTVKEIAYCCGFHSESNFCTSFRKSMGSTPKQYREAGKKG